MKPLACQVEWMKEYANHPSLKILVDKFPNWEDVRYKELKPHVYYSETGGQVRFFVHNPRDEHGYGGRVFHVRMENGEERHIKGPWSSSASNFTAMGFPCLDVAFTEDPEVWERGYTFFGGSVTLELAQEAIKLCEEDIELQLIDFVGYPLYIPVLKNNPCTHEEKHSGNRKCKLCGMHYDIKPFDGQMSEIKGKKYGC